MKNFLSLITFLFITALYIQAQPPELRMEEINNLNDLTSQSVKAVAQDSLGYIWIGTVNGLNRYNGYEIENYKKTLEDSTCLTNNKVTCLYCDDRGDLWIGTQEGLCRYNREYDNFVRVAHQRNHNGLEGLTISEICEDHSGDLYVSEGSFVYKYVPADDSLQLFASVEEGIITSFLFDKNGHLWAGTNQKDGLYQFDSKGRSVKRYLSDDTGSSTISHSSVRDLAIKNNFLWIATFGGGVNVLNIERGNFQYYHDAGTFEKRVNFINIDNKGRIWIIDLNTLWVWNQKNNRFHSYYPDEKDQYSIRNNPKGILQGKQGNYWTYYSDKGITVSTERKGFQTFNADPENSWQTSSYHISAICEDKQGNLWLGNPYNGIDVFLWNKGKVRSFSYQEDNEYSLGKGSVFEIYRDEQDVMWIGSHMGGLQYYRPEKECFISYKHDSDDPFSIAKNDVRSITEDGQGNLWLAVHGKGVDKFNKEKEIFQHFNEKNSGLSNDWTFDVLYSGRGNLWVGTAWGLNLLHEGDSLFHNYIHSDTDTNTISNDEITCLYEDTEGKIWIGTADGLNKYNGDKDHFIRYKNFNNNYICSIEEDEQHRLWLSTLGGLIRFKPENGETFYFNKNDGLQSGEFTPRASYKNVKGELFFGGIRGVNVFTPGELTYNRTPPEVVMSEVELFYQEVNEYGKNAVLPKHVSVADTMTLNYGQNIVTFQYTALNLIQPGENQYAYMMEGFDEKWHYVGNKREATYTNLHPGEYVFKVKASNNDGVWNEKGASLVVEILPPWYLTSWFFIGAGILVLGVFYLIYRWRIASLKKRSILLENKVSERTRKLKETNYRLIDQTKELNNLNTILEERQTKIEEQTENLEQANKELKQNNAEKDKLFSIIAHDLRSPFNGILGFSQIMLRDISQGNYENLKDTANYIYTSALQVYDLLENLLQWARSQTGKISRNPKNIHVDELIQYNIDLIHETARQKNITIQKEGDSDFNLTTDPEMIGTVMRNLLSNAVKFTPRGGQVTVSTEKQADRAIISITDTGFGIPEEDKKQIFTMENKKSMKGTEGEKGSGLGLIVSKEFVEHNGGRIWVEDNQPQGSRFSFSLPL